MVSKRRIKAALLTAFLMLTLTACSRKNYTKEEGERIVNSESYKNKTLDIGEHTISVPYKDKDPTREIIQYPYYAGYKAVGIAAKADRGSYISSCIVYQNEYPVECHGMDLDNNGNIIYDFGNPIGYEKPEGYQTRLLKLFNPGEHILSIPFKDDTVTKRPMQYEYHEGYEIVGVASYYYDGGNDRSCVLYVNTEPVLCAITEEKKGEERYITFGQVVKKEAEKILINK